jgi:hypothetical protein
MAPAEQAARKDLSPLRSRIVRHPIATFLVLVYATTTALVFVPKGLTEPGLLPGGATPHGILVNVLGSAVPAFIVTALVSGKAGVRDLARRSFRWRVRLRWYLIRGVAEQQVTSGRDDACRDHAERSKGPPKDNVGGAKKQVDAERDYVPSSPSVGCPDDNEHDPDQRGNTVRLHPSHDVRRAIEERSVDPRAGVVAEQFQGHLYCPNQNEDGTVDQEQHSPPQRPSVGLVGSAHHNHAVSARVVRFGIVIDVHGPGRFTQAPSLLRVAVT